MGKVPNGYGERVVSVYMSAGGGGVRIDTSKPSITDCAGCLSLDLRSGEAERVGYELIHVAKHDPVETVDTCGICRDWMRR